MVESSNLSDLFSQLQNRYPTSSLLSELVQIHEGSFVVRAIVEVGGVPLVTSLAAAATVEQAEDHARLRVLRLLGIDAVIAPVGLGPGIANLTSAPHDLQAQLLSGPLDLSHSLDQGALLGMPSEADLSRMPEPSLFSTPQETVLPLPITPSFSAAEPSVELKAKGLESKSATTTVPLIREEPSSRLSFLPDLFDVEDASSQEEAIAGPSDEVSKKPPARNSSRASKERSPELSEPSLAETPVDPDAFAEDAIDDLSDPIAQTKVEMERIGWTNEQGRKHLMRTYAKRSRQQLTDDELIDFLKFLKTCPSGNDTLFKE